MKEKKNKMLQNIQRWKKQEQINKLKRDISMGIHTLLTTTVPSFNNNDLERILTNYIKNVLKDTSFEFKLKDDEVIIYRYHNLPYTDSLLLRDDTPASCLKERIKELEQLISTYFPYYTNKIKPYLNDSFVGLCIDKETITALLRLSPTFEQKLANIKEFEKFIQKRYNMSFEDWAEKLIVHNEVKTIKEYIKSRYPEFVDNMIVDKDLFKIIKTFHQKLLIEVFERWVEGEILEDLIDTYFSQDIDISKEQLYAWITEFLEMYVWGKKRFSVEVDDQYIRIYKYLINPIENPAEAKDKIRKELGKIFFVNNIQPMATNNKIGLQVHRTYFPDLLVFDTQNFLEDFFTIVTLNNYLIQRFNKQIDEFYLDNLHEPDEGKERITFVLGEYLFTQRHSFWTYIALNRRVLAILDKVEFDLTAPTLAKESIEETFKKGGK